MAATGYWERITQSRISRRRALTGAAAAGVGAAALGLVGCGGGGDDGGSGSKAPIDPNAILYNWQQPDETKEAKEGGTHVGPSSNDIQGGLDPTRSNSFTTLAVAGVAYEPLLIANSGAAIDPASADGRKIIGGLAESYEINADASQFTMKLRQNVKFHPQAPVNGRVMVMDDWRVSWERSLASPLLGAALKDAVDKVEQPDDKTWIFKMKGPNVAFLRILTVGSSSFYIVPKEITSDEARFDKQTVGTNYRVLTNIQPAVGREYSRHVDYWRGKPFIDKWSVPIIPETANQRAQFITGNSHGYTPPQTDVLQLRKDYPKARMVKGDPAASYRTNFFGYKEFDSAPWKDERVRVALRMGVDWKGMRDVISSAPEFAAAGVPVESRQPTHVKAGGLGYPYWLNPEENKLGDVSKNFLFNIAEAKKLLAAAGFANGFEMDGYVNGGTEYGTTVYPQVVQITIDQLKLNVNVTVKLNRPPYAEFLPNIYTKRDFKGLVLQQPEFTYSEIDQELFNWYHTKGQRYKWMSDTTLDGMIDKQRGERDDAKRTTIIQDIQKHMAKSMYTIPGDGVSGGFGFQQPWYRNTANPAYREWIDDKAKYA